METPTKRTPSKLYAIKSYGKAVKKVEELNLAGYEQIQTLKEIGKQMTQNYMNE